VDNQQSQTKSTHIASTSTLERRYPIRYRWPSRIPVQLHIVGNKLRIRFFVHYHKSMLDNFPGTDITYADIAEAGIRSNWTGKYSFPWLADDGYERAMARASFRVLKNEEDPSDADTIPSQPSVRVSMEFIRYGTRKQNRRFPLQKYFRVRLARGSLFASHVISPPWRWYWGFFRSLEIESLYLNWSRQHPGNITLQQTKSRHAFQQTCAHEIGHLLGLGDAYAANYRFFYEAPGTGSYMMCHNRRVQPEEIEMVLKSHMTNRMHYFPKEFRAKTFVTGIRREIKLAYHTLATSDVARKNRPKRNT
jgi:hypothetical protein